jgi:hypothetical protein
MQQNYDLHGIRVEIVRLASSARTRRTDFTAAYPTTWHPTGIADPRSMSAFTEAGAWEWVIEHVSSGVTLYPMILDKPPGRKAYYFEAPAAFPPSMIYVKLQICGDHIRGRSFHLSNRG